MPDPAEITQLVQLAQAGDAIARERLYGLIYLELHCQAERFARQKGAAGMATSLVHEGFLRLFREGSMLNVPNRRYFYFAAARKMRDVLVERIRTKSRRPALSSLDELADQVVEDLRRSTNWEFIALHEALDVFLASENPRQRRRHQLIDLTYFTGLTVKEAAEILEVSYSQAREDERLAIAELALAIRRAAP